LLNPHCTQIRRPLAIFCGAGARRKSPSRVERALVARLDARAQFKSKLNFMQVVCGLFHRSENFSKAFGEFAWSCRQNAEFWRTAVLYTDPEAAQQTQKISSPFPRGDCRLRAAGRGRREQNVVLQGMVGEMRCRSI
jgi:hypothetical protein